MSDSLPNEFRQQDTAKAHKRLISIGRNPDQLEDFLVRRSPETEKQTLETSLALLDSPVPEDLIKRLIPLIHSFSCTTTAGFFRKRHCTNIYLTD